MSQAQTIEIQRKARQMIALGQEILEMTGAPKKQRKKKEIDYKGPLKKWLASN